ncbi:MAG: response regulator [Elusimicrobiota bacterium]
MNILLVEDDGAMATLLRDRFQLSGHGVARFEDGAAAWEALRGRPLAFDLAVLDVQLPGLNGWELCRRIKSDPALRGLPVLILTAKKPEPDDPLPGEGGPDARMGKPFDFKELLALALKLAGPRRS